MAFKLRSGNKTTFKEMGSSSLKQADIMSKDELKKSLGVTDMPAENYEAYLRNRGVNIIPAAAEISTLSDESYDKLSDPQKQVYDAFGGQQTAKYIHKFTPGRSINRVRREGDLHWEDALQMVEDSDVENISNTPQETRDVTGQLVRKFPMNKYGDFRAHAWTPFDGGGDIFIPGVDAHKSHYRAWNERGGPTSWSDEEIDKKALDSYVEDLTAELGHLYQRNIANENLRGGHRELSRQTNASRKVREELLGHYPDRSNYHIPADREFQTHFGAEGGEATMYDKYNLDARMRRMYPSLFRKKKK